MFSQFDESLKNMHNRIFFLWVGLCMIANIVGTAFNYIAQGWVWISKLCVFIGILMVAVIIFSVLIKRREIASVTIFLLLTWIEFPALYTVYGPIVVAYFALSIFAGTIVFPRKWYYLFASTSVVWYGLVILYSSFDEPLLTIVYNEMTYFIVAFAIIILEIGLLYYYEKQNKELNEVKDAIEYNAVHDALTGLFNRGYLMTDLEKRMAGDRDFYIALIDIDNFKKVNDNLGHQKGDDVLKIMGETIIATVGENGYSARYGGEEIVIIFDDLSEDECRRKLLHIRNTVNRHFKQTDDLTVTFSGGFGKAWDYTAVNELIKSLDDRLYEAKKSGKDRVL